MSKLTSYGEGIYSIDADYLRPKLAAIHLIVENGRAAFVDTGCNSSLPNVLASLDELKIPHENVDYVVLSHIHLDRADGPQVAHLESVASSHSRHPRDQDEYASE